ncbi:glycoside hydrolase family 3 N-terminal domain-containing protein [Dinghuibacter silviterrae]|uniref:beta-N-acetylhexosaminidase n=1 Tax=Dinghuibacter silviterrae TaxID=1539049 RepID=A0A4R8DRL8_9BACT|nr:glycoside hydrolase family 3 N-terminal domain-containing protein [Dinghuibacter silviterrae]TDW99996.1 beta-glucosidase-like glycosyl hydrolase [Dinghuibacter silviterrae]
MIKLFCAAAFSLLTRTTLQAQVPDAVARHWADSVLLRLSVNDKIAQLMVIRASDQARYYTAETEDAVRRYHVGGLCFFQGGPVRQAELTNAYQQMSAVPLLITQDAEWGLGMRLDSVDALPHQMMLGAVRDTGLIERIGEQAGIQCKRLGVTMDLAPDIDVNNNPDNPVINDRSFGENKYTVARYGALYVKGLGRQGVMGCAKHFPGHGDTQTDSHLDLPVIRKTRAELDSLELYPFRSLVASGVPAVMVGHLYIPALDARENRPTSLSDKAIGLLRQWGYTGIVMTDALDMKGVTKYFPKGNAALEALRAGNDLLCLPVDVKATLKSVRKAVRHHVLSAASLDDKVRKVLMAKYTYVGVSPRVVDTGHLVQDLNAGTAVLRRQVALEALTLLRRDNPRLFPLLNRPERIEQGDSTALRVAYLGIGLEDDNAFARKIREGYRADAFYFPYTEGMERVPTLLRLLKGNYQAVVVGIHGYSRRPQGHYGLSAPALALLDSLQTFSNAVTFVFGNPYAIRYFPGMHNLVACYEDDSVTQCVAAEMLAGRKEPMGVLPVSAGGFAVGTGLQPAVPPEPLPMPAARPEDVGLNARRLQVIDSLAEDAIARHATPGCVVLVARNGKIVWDKAYGYMTFDRTESVRPDDLYDLASVTKICATTVSVMQLYDEGKIDLDKTLGDYLPWLAGTDKAGLFLRDIMLHQAGLKAFIPFYKDVSDKKDDPLPAFFTGRPETGFTVRVAEGLYMRNDYVDSMYRQIATSPLGPEGKYVYSDNDFILMGKIVEAVSGMSLDQYARQHFYVPLGMITTGFHPRDRFPLSQIAPTEDEKTFRRQLLRGDVHDPGAAMFGGVSGHAGLFSDAYDLSILLQMLLNGGEMNGVRYIRDSTVRYFTDYHSTISRRGFGFDKPEKDNAGRPDPYPCRSASPETFGHTGFTGTCIWVDPVYNLVFVFLSNRVCPDGNNNLLSKLNVRSNIQEAIYQAME